jgi:hypothetical protein
MTNEMTIKLLQEEIKVQSTLIKLLVKFYDLSSNVNECDFNEVNTLVSEIENKFDLDQFRPKKDKGE